MPTITSLYSMAVGTVVRLDYVDPILKTLPDQIKNDIIRVANVRGCKFLLTSLLHSKVKSLDLNFCQLSEDELKQLCICNQLRSLRMNPSLHEEYNHPPRVLESLFLHVPFIIKLHIQRNNGVVDSVIHALVQHCPQLIELDVGGCKQFSDEALASIASLNNLTSLCLSATNVSDTGLIKLSTGSCKFSLVELKLLNCLEVSDTGIDAVYEKMKKLIVLDFCGCPKVTSACRVLQQGRVPMKNLTYTVYWN